MRWYRGSLVAVQRDADQTSTASRIIRLQLDSAGRSSAGLRVLDASAPNAAARASALDSGVVYYLSEGVIRRATVR